MRLRARFVRMPQRLLLQLAWRRRNPQVHQCVSATFREMPRSAPVRVKPTVLGDETGGAFHPDAAFVLGRTIYQRNSLGRRLRGAEHSRYRHDLELFQFGVDTTNGFAVARASFSSLSHA